MTIYMSDEGVAILRESLKTLRLNISHWDQNSWINRNPNPTKSTLGLIPPVVLEPMISGGQEVPEEVCDTTMCLAGFIAFANNPGLKPADFELSYKQEMIPGIALNTLGIFDESDREDFSDHIFYATSDFSSVNDDDIPSTGSEDGDARLGYIWYNLRGFDETEEVALRKFTVFVHRIEAFLGVDFSDVLTIEGALG